MKKTITLISFILFTLAAAAQTTAPDFTAKDCSGTSHNLYNDLASGKVVVVNWVMPCPACTDPTAHCAIAVKNLSNSSQVIHYVLDDMGDQDCATVTSWCSSNGVDMSKLTVLDNKSNVVNESNYGGSGMPHIMVVGGNSHKIYFNKMDTNADDTAGIKQAISAAIADLGVDRINNKLSFSLAPNPAKDKLYVTYSGAVRNVTIMTEEGRIVAQQEYGNNTYNPAVNISSISAGIYVVRVTDKDGHFGVQKIEKQ